MPSENPRSKAFREAHEAIMYWRNMVVRAAMDFEARWTMGTLRRVDYGLASDLHYQKNLFAEACVTGIASVVVEHGAALVRGYAVATTAMERTGEAHTAYVIGHDPVSGTTIAISDNKACTAVVRELYGPSAVWMTPDEVAGLVANSKVFQALRDVRLLYPAAETVQSGDTIDPGEAGRSDTEGGWSAKI